MLNRFLHRIMARSNARFKVSYAEHNFLIAPLMPIIMDIIIALISMVLLVVSDKFVAMSDTTSGLLSNVSLTIAVIITLMAVVLLVSLAFRVMADLLNSFFNIKKHANHIENK